MGVVREFAGGACVHVLQTNTLRQVYTHSARLVRVEIDVCLRQIWAFHTEREFLIAFYRNFAGVVVVVVFFPLSFVVLDARFSDFFCWLIQ